MVGGGDSALEAAARIAEQPNAEVVLSYRGDAFNRARAKNRDRVDELIDAGRITALLSSTVERIKEKDVEIKVAGELRFIPNDDVIICAGGLLPTQFLNDVGVAIETKYGTV